jgi:hypothetical protein
MTRTPNCMLALQLGCQFVLAATLLGCEAPTSQVIDVSTEDAVVDIPTWEEFESASTVYGKDGVQYIVEEDIPIRSVEALREHYERYYLARVDKLAVRTFSGADDAWPNGDQRALEYCVSTTFPNSGTWSRSAVIAAMSDAAARWKQVANINFTYVPSQDSDCLSGSTPPHSQFFKIAPKDLSASGAVACAFFPVSRDTCSELDGSTVGVDTNTVPPISVTRTLTHELGHVLGLLHEYQRIDAPGGCGGLAARYLTDYDSTSIMQASAGICGGSPMESLSALDGIGSRVLYGAPPAWVPAYGLVLL